MPPNKSEIHRDSPTPPDYQFHSTWLEDGIAFNTSRPAQNASAVSLNGYNLFHAPLSNVTNGLGYLMDPDFQQRQLSLLSQFEIQTLLETAASLDQTKEASQEAKEKRLQLNHFLDQFAEAFKHISTKENERFSVWCEVRGISPAYVENIYKQIGAQEQQAVAKRFAKANKRSPLSILEFALPSTVYSRQEIESLRWKYAIPLLRTGLHVLGQLGRFAQNNPDLEPVLDLIPNAIARRGIRFVANALSHISSPYSTDLSEPTAPLIQEAQKLDPISREMLLSMLQKLAARQPYTELPIILSEAIDRANPVSIARAEEAKVFALKYLNAVLEDGRRFLEVEEATEIVPQDWETELARASTLPTQLTFQGVSFEEHRFALIRDLNEASQLVEGNKQLQEAETEIANIYAAGKIKDPFTDPALVAARQKWQVAMNRFTLERGLGAQDDTFLKLPEVIQGLNPAVFEGTFHNQPELLQLFKSFKKQQGVYIVARGEVVGAAQEHKKKPTANSEAAFEAAKKTCSAAKRAMEKTLATLQGQLRQYMDIPGHGRRVQAALMSLNAARDAIVNNPTLIAKLLTNASEQQLVEFAFFEPEAIERYQAAYRQYAYYLSDSSSNPELLDVALNQLRLATEELLSCPGAAALLNAAAKLHENLNMEGLNDALSAHQDYQKKYQAWIVAQREANEKQLPKIVAYQAWKEKTTFDLIVEEAEILAASAQDLVKAAQSEKILYERAKAKPDFQVALGEYRQVLADLPDLFKALKDYIERAAERYNFLADPNSLKKDYEVNLKYLQQLSLNRAVEALHSKVAALCNAAARIAMEVGVIAEIPQRVSFTATLLHKKLSRNLDPSFHQNQAETLAFDYLGTQTLDRVLEAMWTVQQGMTTDHVEHIILDWARHMTQNFHLVEVDDHRSPHLLPGQKEIADFSHNGGWHIDYATGLVLSPGKRPYLLMAKNDLGDKMPQGMNLGVELLARSMPPDGCTQDEIETLIAESALYGFAGAFLREASRDILFYGAMTMGVGESLDPSRLDHLESYLTGQGITAMELDGNGRFIGVTERVLALRGTAAAYRNSTSSLIGGHEAGPKPDKPFGVKRTQARVSVTPVEFGALPRGSQLYQEEALPYVKATSFKRIAGNAYETHMKARGQFALHAGAQVTLAPQKTPLLWGRPPIPRGMHHG